MSRFAKNLAGFLLGFLLTLLARHALVPPVLGPVEKATAPVIEGRASCSVLFLGPSYVAEQVVPEAFNREAKRMGWSGRACKYGTTALRGYELRLWTERFLSHDWPRLEVVVLDITLGDGLGFDPENWLKPRVVEWHTLGSAPWLLDYYAHREPLPLAKKIPRLWAHARHIGAHYAELGHGVEALGGVRLLERLRPAASDAPLPAQQRDGSGPRRRKRGAAYERHVAKMKANLRASGPRVGSSDWALELRSVVRAHGKEAYFLIAPVLYHSSVPLASREGDDRLVVLDFDDPRRYPDLYREEMRGNSSHLRGNGSILYSEILAREIKALLERRGHR